MVRSKADTRGFPTFTESQRRSGTLLFETSVSATEVYDGAAELGSISSLYAAQFFCSLHLCSLQFPLNTPPPVPRYGQPSKRWAPRSASPVRYSLGFKSNTPRPWDAPASGRRAETPGPGYYDVRAGAHNLSSSSTTWSVRGRSGGVATPFEPDRLSASFRSVTPRSGQHFSTKPPNKVGDLDRFVLPSDASRSAAARRDWVRRAPLLAHPTPTLTDVPSRPTVELDAPERADALRAPADRPAQRRRAPQPLLRLSCR